MSNLSRSPRGPRTIKAATLRQLCNDDARPVGGHSEAPRSACSAGVVLASEATKQRRQQTRQIAILAIVVILAFNPNVPSWLVLVIAALGSGVAVIGNQRAPWAAQASRKAAPSVRSTR